MSTAMNTQEYFNNYFNPTVEISESTNDAILSYFEQQTGNRETAKQLVQVIIDTAAFQNIDPLVVLNSFTQLKPNELSPILALYLNSSRTNTSYLGVKLQPKQSQFVTRSIVN
jgi:hypothetical protein